MVEDDGPAFDPLLLPAPDVAASLEERKVGGLGVFLVRQMMDAVRYQRVATRNQLRMTKRLSAGGASPRVARVLDRVHQSADEKDAQRLGAALADGGAVERLEVGSGRTIAHGDAQLASRWKEDGRRIIQDTCGTKLLLPGITDISTLEAASKLCGDAAFREHGQDHLTRHPAMTPDMIRQLPPGRALAIRGSMSPVIATLPMAWKDRAYRRAKQRGHATAVLPAVPAVARVTPLVAPVTAAPKVISNGHGLADVLPGPWEPQ